MARRHADLLAGVKNRTGGKMTEDERNATLEEIGRLELAMFLAVGAEDESAANQRRPEMFALTRLMNLSPHSDGFLLSYLDDLRLAAKAGRNLILAKYANEESDESPESALPREEIADAEADFLAEGAERYPQVFKPGDPEVFRGHLLNELRALSPQSLRLYAREVREARETGRNLAIERHNWLAEKLGKEPLE